MALGAEAQTSDRFDSRRWLLVFLALGVALRLMRYACRLALNGDEASVGLNIVHRSFRGLLQPLNYGQVAPIGFLWLERATSNMLGMSEWAMRLWPMLAGIAALIAFALWARLLASKLAAMAATAILAVGYFSVQHAVELKPYSLDLLISIGLFWLATLFLQRGQARWVVLLAIVQPIALALSYPALFVAGGIALALALPMLSAPAKARAAYLAALVSLAASFFFIVVRVGAGQRLKTARVMQIYWHDAFPPHQPIKLLAWLVSAHTGAMFDYPAGGPRFASTASLLLAALGIACWVRAGKKRFIALLVLPFVLTLAAAAIRRYPYGGSERVEQHLAPAIVLLMGVGIAWIIQQFESSRRAVIATTLFAALIAVGIAGALIADFGIAAKIHDSARAFAQLALTSQPDNKVAVVQSRIKTPVDIQWYLQTQGQKVAWSVSPTTAWANWPGPISVLSSQPRPDLAVQWEKTLRRKPLIEYRRNSDSSGKMEHWELLVFPSIH